MRMRRVGGARARADAAVGSGSDGGGAAAARRSFAPYAGRVAIAAMNGPQSAGVGRRGAIEAAHGASEAQRFARRPSGLRVALCSGGADSESWRVAARSGRAACAFRSFDGDGWLSSREIWTRSTGSRTCVRGCGFRCRRAVIERGYRFLRGQPASGADLVQEDLRKQRQGRDCGRAASQGKRSAAGVAGRAACSRTVGGLEASSPSSSARAAADVSV